MIEDKPTGLELRLPGLYLRISQEVCDRAIRWLTVATVAVTLVTAVAAYLTAP